MSNFSSESLSLDVEEVDNNSSSSSDHHQLQINFKFTCRSIVSNYVIPQGSTSRRLLSRIDKPLVESSIVLNLRQLLSKETAQQALENGLENWDVCPEGLRCMTKFAVNEAREIVRYVPPHHNCLHLHYRVCADHMHFFDESWAIGLAARLSAEEDDGDKGFMVRAVESSIESLEKKTISVDSAGTCSVCLDDMFPGCEAVWMPCSHVSHGDCIGEWLRTSHYCPVCRFELPTK